MYVPYHLSSINSREDIDSYMHTLQYTLYDIYVAMYACPCISQQPYSMCM